MINIQGQKLSKRIVNQHKKAEKYLYDKTGVIIGKSYFKIKRTYKPKKAQYRGLNQSYKKLNEDKDLDEYETLDICEEVNKYNELNICEELNEYNEELDYEALDELKKIELEQKQIVSIDELVRNIDEQQKQYQMQQVVWIEDGGEELWAPSLDYTLNNKEFIALTKFYQANLNQPIVEVSSYFI
ncbi:18847_t:CDS:2 [Racocetra fulgida]|uniref:18847_t:CDS:1 n=1 Tax=Racocetra fulgida TaxID=60492 RepID=A0A9N9F2M1_9GLOM|nr:18847_t:CDS:2 [Racocetra fulgida]